MENQGGNGVNQNVNTNQNPALSMKFHDFYKWWLIITGAISALADTKSLYSWLVAALSIVTGICLMKMMPVGKTLQMIFNVLGIVGGGVMAVGSVAFIFGGSLISTLLNRSFALFTTGLSIFFGFFMLLVSAGIIVWNACIISYYNKRQHLFK